MVNAAHNINRISKGIHHDSIFVVAELLTNMIDVACDAREKIQLKRDVKQMQHTLENMAYKDREKIRNYVPFQLIFNVHELNCHFAKEYSSSLFTSSIDFQDNKYG